MTAQFPEMRLRRLRRTAAMRRLVGAHLPGPEKFIWPVFVKDGSGVREAIDAMPGQYRYSPDTLLEATQRVVEQGVGGVLVFGLPSPDQKNGNGHAASNAAGIVPAAVRALKDRFGDALVVVTDVCLCAYTTHGHCGPVDADGRVLNDAANVELAQAALAHAAAGADIVAPSAMMDGQVASIRGELDGNGFSDAAIMSYSTKFASSMYGPFRDAEQSAPQHGDRQGYQASLTDLPTALRESELDEAEGADMLMVKPALMYLDVITMLRDRTDLPIAAYNVSGEYAMLHATADRGWGDLQAMVRESIMSISRAGADIIISYWADRYAELIAS